MLHLTKETLKHLSSDLEHIQGGAPESLTLATTANVQVSDTLATTANAKASDTLATTA